MINTATPFRKPVITALETKRTRKPSLNRPASNWITPTSSTSTTSASTLRSAGNSSSTTPAATDSAAVLDTFMNTELLKMAPTGTATISVKMPSTGLTVASRAWPMACGTLTTAKVSAATRSDASRERSGFRPRALARSCCKRVASVMAGGPHAHRRATRATSPRSTR